MSSKQPEATTDYPLAHDHCLTCDEVSAATAKPDTVLRLRAISKVFRTYQHPRDRLWQGLF
ncbi:MAG: hypothetical protein ACI9PN_002602, partial [Candidatus Azotimanducaceae bacterium]